MEIVSLPATSVGGRGVWAETVVITNLKKQIVGVCVVLRAPLVHRSVRVFAAWPPLHQGDFFWKVARVGLHGGAGREMGVWAG